MARRTTLLAARVVKRWLDEPVSGALPRICTVRKVLQALLICLLVPSHTLAQDSQPPTAWDAPNRVEEKFAKSYSFKQGVRFLEQVAVRWGEKRRCVTCHTNGYAMVTLAEVRPESAALAEILGFARSYLDQQVRRSQEEPGQERVEGIVATTAMLMLGSLAGRDADEAAIRAGLDYAWSGLSEDDVWEGWLQCNWPPFESDVCFGNALMLVALGKAISAERVHSDQRKRILVEADRQGAKRLIAGLRKQHPLGLHDKAMRLWAGSYWEDLNEASDKAEWLKQIRQTQHEDGGWSIRALAADSWKHDDGQPLPTVSDAYPTAFLTYVLREVDAERSAGAIERGKQWLKSQQRESGRWFSRSPRRDNHHFISHAATAFALMCLQPDG